MNKPKPFHFGPTERDRTVKKLGWTPKSGDLVWVQKQRHRTDNFWEGVVKSAPIGGVVQVERKPRLYSTHVSDFEVAFVFPRSATPGNNT